jgi:muramoyltetrapeptide carboxypeptidase
VTEGQCLRSGIKDATAPRESRAAELRCFLNDPEVAATFPPWGSELASEILQLIDFEHLRSVTPKSLLGYSDISTLHLPLSLIAGWATAHGPNMMDLAPTQTDPLTSSALRVLASDFSQPVVQPSSTMFQKQWTDFAVQADAPLKLTKKTQWKRLDGAPSSLAFESHRVGG